MTGPTPPHSPERRPRSNRPTSSRSGSTAANDSNSPRPPRGWRSGVIATAVRPTKGGNSRPPGLPPRPPRRSPQPPRPPLILSSREQLIRSSLAIVAALIFGCLLTITLLGNLQHLVSQQQLTNSFRLSLSEGTAPVSEGTVEKVLLENGAPVGLIDIPSIGVHEVIVEGSNSATTRSGPGHRRDTVLPGQIGVSVVMGRAAAFGGPFGRLQELKPGEEFTVTTGQGLQTFTVIGLRYAGDPSPAPPGAGQSRLILETARGPAFIPSGIARVDAELTSEAQPAGARQSSYATLPLADKEMATDTTTIWALVFALQFFLVIELAMVWALRRVGGQKTWIVFLPVVTLGGFLVADQVVRLLPNLL
jgi:sortase A